MPVLISRYHTRIVVKYWSKIILILLENILNVKIYFDNKYLKDNKGQIIAANHQSAFDTIFFFSSI